MSAKIIPQQQNQELIAKVVLMLHDFNGRINSSSTHNTLTHRHAYAPSPYRTYPVISFLTKYCTVAESLVFEP
jgi:hypothetical protein